LVVSEANPNDVRSVGVHKSIHPNLRAAVNVGLHFIQRQPTLAHATLAKEVLKVLLRTPVYREWMPQFNVGTQYPVIRDEDILDLPIPKIDLATQTKISQLVQQSFSLKAESERLLSVAKRAVEMAIEQDEAAAMAWIAGQ
jgi:restriction endonuclease S subunit